MNVATVTKTKKLAPRILDRRITAAQLLRTIRQLVLEEPARLHMGWWGYLFNGKRPQGARGMGTPTNIPACGTVGCIAGWGQFLLRTPTQTTINVGLASDLMVRLLGDETELTGRHGLFSCGLGDLGGLFPGTRPYARAVVSRIDAYLACHPHLEQRVIDVRRRRVVPS